VEKCIRVGINCWWIIDDLLKYLYILMENFKWRLTEYPNKNIRKYNLELVYKNKDRDMFQKLLDKILELNTGIAAPYKYWFKPEYLARINEKIQKYNVDAKMYKEDNIVKKIIKSNIEKYIQENSTDVNKLDAFLNFNNTTLGEIINDHNALENLKFKQQRDKLTKMVNRRSVGRFINDNIDISSSDIEKIKHIDVEPGDIHFTITDLDHFIKHFDDEHDLSPESTDSPSTPMTKRKIQDINNINVYPEELRSIYLDFNRNKKFRDCVDDLLNLDDDELIEILEEKNVNRIVKLLKRISELGPHDYMRCMDHLGDYCGSDVVHNYMQVITLIFNYFGSSIDINSKTPIEADNDFMKKTLPYVKKIYKKIIENARTINYYKLKRGQCESSDNEIIDRYQTIYDSLFHTKSCETTYSLFNKYEFPGFDSITKYATENTLVFVIILIFISFIFSKFVSMMSVQPIPVNKNIVQ